MPDPKNQLGGGGGDAVNSGGDGSTSASGQLGGAGPGIQALTTNPPTDPNATNNSGWSGGGSGGGGGGGGGSDDGPSDAQKESARNLRPIIHYNYDTLGGKYDLGDKVYDTADELSKNLQDWQVAMAGRNASGDWYRQQQRLQSSMKNMRDEMGNAAYGSDYIDMYEAFARADDQMDDETLRSYRKNLEEIDANYFDAIAANISSRNKLAADTEISMRELGADWASQLSNINGQLANGEYQAGVTGIGENRKEGDAPEDAGDFDALIDRENDTLKFPDWLDTEFASEHWSDAFKPSMRDFYRPDLAGQTDSASGLRNRKTSTASAATRKTKGLASYLQPYSGNMMNRRTQ